MFVPRRAGNRSVKKTTSPMSTFVSALGPGSGLRALSLRPFGPLTSVPKSLSTPFERTETVSPSALATKSSPSQSADAQTAICPVRALRFYIDRSGSFRQSIQLLGAMVGVRRAEPYRNKVCHTGLWTLSWRHIQPKVWKMPSAH